MGAILTSNTTQTVSDVSNLSNFVVIPEDYPIDMSSAEQERIARIQNYWRIYKGEHWDISEQDTDQPTPVFNKSKRLINKILTHFVGKPFTFNYFDEQIETLLAPYVKYIMEKSGGIPLFGWRSGQMGAITGDCFLKPSYDAKEQCVKILVCNSEDTFVSYFHATLSDYNPDNAIIRWRTFDNEGKVVWKREIWNKATVKTLLGSDISSKR